MQTTLDRCCSKGSLNGKYFWSNAYIISIFIHFFSLIFSAVFFLLINIAHNDVYSVDQNGIFEISTIFQVSNEKMNCATIHQRNGNWRVMATLAAISTATTVAKCLHFNVLYFINLSGFVHCVAWQINLPFTRAVSVREIVHCKSRDTALTTQFSIYHAQIFHSVLVLHIHIPCLSLSVFLIRTEAQASTPDSKTIILDRKSKSLGPIKYTHHFQQLLLRLRFTLIFFALRKKNTAHNSISLRIAWTDQTNERTIKHFKSRH